jgi:hypothetical protein
MNDSNRILFRGVTTMYLGSIGKDLFQMISVPEIVNNQFPVFEEPIKGKISQSVLAT